MILLLTTVWLVVCAVQDLSHQQVSNWLTLPPFVAAAIAALADGGETLLLFGVVLSVMLVLYRMGGVGGADVKILSVLSVVSPLAFLLALFANAMVGVWFWAKRRPRYPAVPAFAVGSFLACFVHISQGGLR